MLAGHDGSVWNGRALSVRAKQLTSCPAAPWVLPAARPCRKPTSLKFCSRFRHSVIKLQSLMLWHHDSCEQLHRRLKFCLEKTKVCMCCMSEVLGHYQNERVRSTALNVVNQTPQGKVGHLIT
eukprot:6055628-Amphidinium_carterae.1